MEEEGQQPQPIAQQESESGVKVLSTGKIMPTPIIVFSVLFSMLGILTIVLGLLYFTLFSKVITGLLTISSSLVGIMVGAIILIMSCGILYFFIGRGLWKGQKWARIVVIILYTLGSIVSIVSLVFIFIQGAQESLFPALSQISFTMSIITALFSLAMSLAIFSYFTFSKKVKEAFA
jgi:hypothetical protein